VGQAEPNREDRLQDLITKLVRDFRGPLHTEGP
jgi:hypothetical protein